MAVAALAAEGESAIEGTESVSKSYPAFFDAINRLTIT
jgi:5-enolpyruvylshikimate-3-phosphate synthase